MYLKTVKDTQNLRREQCRKPSRRGFQIISLPFRTPGSVPHLGLANAPIVETKFLELAMSLLDFSTRIPLGTFSILILHVQFACKTSEANQICCTHNMCIITQNDRKCQNASKCLLRNGTESNDTSSYILLDHSNAFGLSGEMFCREQAYQSLALVGKGGGELSFTLFPLLGPPCILIGPTWHMHSLAIGPTI